MTTYHISPDCAAICVGIDIFHTGSLELNKKLEFINTSASKGVRTE